MMKTIRFRNKHKITREVNRIAQSVIKEKLLSFDHKRLEFEKRLEAFYELKEYTSDVLVTRLEEIEYYGKRVNDVLLSSAIGMYLGLFASILESISTPSSDDVALRIAEFIATLVVVAIIAVPLVFFILLLIKQFSKISDYYKLHCQDFEINLIETQLENRKEKVKTMPMTVEEYVIKLDRLYKEQFVPNSGRKFNIQNKPYTTTIEQIEGCIQDIQSDKMRRELLAIYRMKIEGRRTIDETQWNTVTIVLAASSLLISTVSVVLAYTAFHQGWLGIVLILSLVAALAVLGSVLKDCFFPNRKRAFFALVIDVLENSFISKESAVFVDSHTA